MNELYQIWDNVLNKMHSLKGVYETTKYFEILEFWNHNNRTPQDGSNDQFVSFQNDDV